MRRTKEEAEQTRQHLMDVALRVFSTRGYSAARLSDIAADAGVTRGAVYWHFGSKKGLLFAILKEMANPHIQTAMEVLESELEPGRKIREMVCRVMDATDESEAFLAHRQLAMRFMVESPGGFEEFHKHVSRETGKLTRLLLGVIREGQSRGEIRSDVDAKIITGTIGAVLRGSAMMKSVRHLDLLPRGTSRKVVDLVMKGLEPR
ncbi:MAG: TetR family transcriptional regulator [Candidatus Eisenbacteria bacterium]